VSDSAVRPAVRAVDVPSVDRSQSDRRWDRARWLVIIGWIGALCALPFADNGWSFAGMPDAGTVLGISVPSPLADLAVILTVAGVVILVLGPQPWRATRWAWFWCNANPVGMAAFLLLSGPLPGLPLPRKITQRLTGGWGFLLMLVASGTFTLWGATIKVN
jgi:hypothetical protein